MLTLTYLLISLYTNSIYCGEVGQVATR